jgi:mannose-6-phosphate isomerase-like protein (cupin superfamily)
LKNRNVIKKINLKEKLDLFNDYWNPRIVGELNNQHVKLVKFKGEFVFHKHIEEDEMFFVVDGSFTMEFRDKTIEIKKNEFIIIPKGVEHRPIAKKEVSVMLFEPISTINTGEFNNELTRDNLENI